MAKIYVASSWRNEHQPSVVLALRGLGHEVYDFRNPGPGNYGFSWAQVDKKWLQWTPDLYIHELLDNEICQDGFKLDMDALDLCDTCILLLPCGRSAHIEAGWAKGAGKKLYVYISGQGFEPDLMYLMADMVTSNINDIYGKLGNVKTIRGVESGPYSTENKGI